MHSANIDSLYFIHRLEFCFIIAFELCTRLSIAPSSPPVAQNRVAYRSSLRGNGNSGFCSSELALAVLRLLHCLRFVASLRTNTGWSLISLSFLQSKPKA